MATTTVDKRKLPDWLRKVLVKPGSADGQSMKRGDLRVSWVEPCLVQANGSDRLLVRGFNASPTGIGFVSR